jgi:hypothetical protein
MLALARFVTEFVMLKFSSYFQVGVEGLAITFRRASISTLTTSFCWFWGLSFLSISPCATSKAFLWVISSRVYSGWVLFGLTYSPGLISISPSKVFRPAGCTSYLLAILSNESPSRVIPAYTLEAKLAYYSIMLRWPVSSSSFFLAFVNFLRILIFFRWILAISLFFCSVLRILISSILWEFFYSTSFSLSMRPFLTNSSPYECNFLISSYFLPHSRSSCSSMSLLLRLKLASSEIGGKQF